MVIYLAGPYRAWGAYYVKQNIEAAEKIAIELWRRGYAVICPHKNTAFFDGAAPDEVWLKGYLEILSRCDCVVMLPGWNLSEGAVAEYEAAKKKGIRIYHWPADEMLLRGDPS